jgi:hypothetical protein
MISPSVGNNFRKDVYLEDIHVSEKEKSEEHYLKAMIDYWIGTLVREKPDIKTYRNYYSGVRDNKDFEYLTENFGMGTPSKLMFTNLIKPRIDALLGKVVDETFTYKVTCTDDKTVSEIQEGKKSGKLQKITESLAAFSKRMVNAVNSGANELPGLSELQEDIKKQSAKFQSNFISDFEVAAQDVLQYVSQSDRIGMKQNLKLLALDLLIAGECYYRVRCERVGADPILEIIRPEDFFYHRSVYSQNVGDVHESDAVVHRQYLTRKEVLSKYGKFMDKDQREYLFGSTARAGSSRVIHSGHSIEREDDADLISPFLDPHRMEVYNVEWFALNKVEYSDEDKEREETADGYKTDTNKYGWRLDRYEGVRIAGAIYVNCGKSTHMVRSQNEPFLTKLTYGGVRYDDRNNSGKPYSVVGALKDLQDAYDVTIFYRDSMIAHSGVSGDRINVAGIPKVLGNDFMERLFKFIALKKNGFELIDPTEPGAQMFQHYGSFDNSINGKSLDSIEKVIAGMERQADITAGTNPQMLGQISERDAVGNVKQGIHQSLMINEDLLELMRDNQKKMLGSMLNTAQICYRKGKKGSYIAGSESYIFEILPENFCYSDFAISITYGSKDEIKLRELKNVAKELIASNQIAADVLVHVILSDSITEVKKLVSDAVKRQKEENNQLGQATGQVEQLQQQLKQLEAELNSTKQKLNASEAQKQQSSEADRIAKQEADKRKLDIEEQKIQDLKEFQDGQIGLKRETVQLEREQLYLDTGSAKEVKNL